MNFVITSLSALQDSSFLHLYSESELFASGDRFGSSTLVQVSDPWYGSTRAEWFAESNAVSICAKLFTNERQYSIDLAGKLISDYLGGGLNYDLWDHSKPCILLDWQEQQLWVSSDNAGQLPVWYAFQEMQYMVTTDLLVAYMSGFSEPTALGPSQVLHISTATMEVISIHDTMQRYTSGAKENTDILEVYARRTATAAVNAVENALLGITPANLCLPAEGAVAVEVDPLLTSSLFLNCAMEASKISRAVRYTRPRVVETTSGIDDAVLRNVIGRLGTSPSTQSVQHGDTANLFLFGFGVN